MALPQITFTIGGTQIPITVFSVTGGSHGTTGSLSVSASIKALTQTGFDLLGQSNASGTPLEVTLDVSADSGSGRLFSGEFMTSSWEYANDKVTLHCRDKGGKMVDEKRVLAPGQSSGGVQTQNQKISDFVSQIAKAYGLTPKVNVKNDETMGRYFGDENTIVLTSTPKTWWAFLTKLARDTGNEMHVTPKGELVFGTPGDGDTLRFTWRAPFTSDDSYPLLHLDFEHNPSRNKHHTVTVNSYDPTHAKVTTGKAVRGQGTKRYSFHSDGLTADQATKRADAISKDISKREIIAHIQMDFLPSIQPMQPAQISGEIDHVFASYDYVVSEYSHEYSIAERNADLYTQATLLKKGDT